MDRPAKPLLQKAIIRAILPTQFLFEEERLLVKAKRLIARLHFDKIDPVATSTNAIAPVTPEKGRIPIALKTDREAVETAFATIREVGSEKARVIHNKNTLEIAELDVSEALLERLKEKKI
ncbi:MAG: hypothetical protein JRI72_02485 [Deltaproteobacteria bacterium]|nr:hypothetical protein [Deltaproteobacteria bacterium]